ncbi:protein argonaute-2 [Bactrocera neohumeralis]|uniref:protein argonaute-2 n=1 Tax=Bactrocera tryoni TaxID=59916 RepID=UPI001A984F54|nr:protein argonaute-2 [Bactrocera tryoni]XP_050337572.1 protein argonaute-2 [Bactrocera neohumeralis]
MGRKSKNKKSEAGGQPEQQPKENPQHQLESQQPGTSQPKQSATPQESGQKKNKQQQSAQQQELSQQQAAQQKESSKQGRPQHQPRPQQQPTRPQEQRPQQQQTQQQEQQSRPRQQQPQRQQARPQQQRPQPQQARPQHQQGPQQTWPQQQQSRPQQEHSQYQQGPQQTWPQGQQGPQQTWPQQQQSRPQQERSQYQQGPQQTWPQGQQGPQQQQSRLQQERSQSQQGPQQTWPQGQQGPQQTWPQGQQGPQQTWRQQQQNRPQQERSQYQKGQQGPQQHKTPQQHERSQYQQGPQQQKIPQQPNQPHHQQRPQQPQPQQQQRPQQQQTQPQYQQSPQQTPTRQSSVSHSSSSTSLSSAPSQNSISPGTLGIKGEAEANYLIMDLSKMPNKAYHYDVTITPDRPKKFFRNAFTQFMNTYLPGHFAGFDGVKSCYLLEMLPKPVYEGDVSIADSASRQIQFKVSIKPTDNIEVDLGSLRTYRNDRIYDKPMRALQCLEVILANACQQKGLRVGRSFFTRPNQTLDLDGGYELYTGLYQAAILGDVPYLNVDISNKSFPMALNLIDLLNVLRIDPGRSLDQRGLQSLSAHLRALKIIYSPPPSFGAAPRSYKVNEVSRESASSLSFKIDTGEKLTVQSYFASRGYKLKYPHLGCVVAGSSVKPNYLPIELCSIEPGQAIKKKDGKAQVQKMIKFAATSTDERKRKIMEKLQYFLHNNDILLQKFGIRIDNQFIKVPTRLLRAPSIEYRLGKLVDPRNGSWRNLEYLQTGMTLKKTGHKWAVIYNPSRFLRHGTLLDFSNMLFNEAKRMGINLDSEREIQETRDIVKTLEEYKRKDYDLVIVVIPNYGTSYADIKQKAELVCGLLTQCIKEQTLNRRVDNQLIGNLLLKINSKLNGSNHKISAKSHIVLDHAMFMGADVTHPSPDQRNIPSVVGVAASHDLNGASYNMQYRLQESAKEEIDDMQSISRHHLKVYFQKNNCYPNNIIYYRDGVSDGQFKKVNNFEVSAIRAVCKELRITPKITCIIVVKRHHTRFFPTKPTGDKWNNVLPGTVVDQKIVHPNETQFFMVSHQSIQGTAKPTRYNVLVDDAKFTMDELQMMTNNLCYMFPRCNRAVSYPAPAYLAHLVAARGRVYIDGPPLRRALRDEYNKRLINESFMQNTPMFFV